MRTSAAVLALVLLAFAGALIEVKGASPTNPPPDLGDPGRLVKLRLETARAAPTDIVLSGRNAALQLLVSGVFDRGQIHDLTRDVRYHATPDEIVNVDPTGYVTPITEGTATVHAQTTNGLKAEVVVTVTHIQRDLPVNFPNEVVPVFTKYGCNGGGCHGKSGGQNGFSLSLLGFEPADDYEFLVKEGRGRRLFPAAPDRSLLLRKVTGEVPHGGGKRIEVDSPAYQVLRRWIEQGMPFGREEDPRVTSISVLPTERRMSQNAAAQLAVVAHYSDGSARDVTRMTQFESNDSEMAEAGNTGLVTTAQLAGAVAVMARYQGHVGVFRATIPLGVDFQEETNSPNLVDVHVTKNLKTLGLPPSDLADDATFLRRATIDIAGRLPTIQECQAFLSNPAPDKRSRLVDRLVDSPDYADYFANKWCSILRNKRRSDVDRIATYSFHDWLRTGLFEDQPFDELVREILTATGTVDTNPPVAWYREVKDASSQVEDTAQLFLGLRIQCARCHHHPFEKWSQDDYFGFQAFFVRVGRKKGLRNQSRIFHNPGIAQAQNPKTRQVVKPTGLGGSPLDIDAHDDPRHALVDWMVAEDNPFFAPALVNRYWKHFFGRGLVDPEDDMRVTNPAVNPELLDALAKDFIDQGFELKHLVRTICNSSTYQRSAQPNAWNQDDKQNFSRYFPQRLSAEVLLDAIDQMTATTSNFGGVPVGTRAVQLPDNAFDSYFLTVFGRPEGNSACECERTSDANLAQSLHLLNSAEVLGKLANGNGRPALLAADPKRDQQAKIRELYLLAFARSPQPEELAVAHAHIKNSKDPRRAFEDLVWTLINTKEFLFNH